MYKLRVSNNHNSSKINRYLTFLLLAVMLLGTGCRRKEFTLEFAMDSTDSGNWRVVYYASDKKGGYLQESVAVVSNGKGTLACAAVNPSVIWLYTAGQQPIVIYAERGDKIIISGSASQPYKWNVSGNEINEAMTAWRNENADVLASGNPTDVNNAVARYVMANPESEINGLLLLSAYDRLLNPLEFNNLWARVYPSQRIRWAQLTGRSDIMTARAANPGLLRSMRLRTLGNGIDTLRTAKVKGSLLFFWSSGLDNRKATFDSLRTLVKEYPDSSRRIIADICLDSDSITWKSPLRNDSLKGVVRGWMPAGLADTVLMSLGVTRSPYYLVVDTEGRQKYSGDDSKTAFETFRSIAGADKKQ